MSETNNLVRFRTALVRAISMHEGGEGKGEAQSIAIFRIFGQSFHIVE